MTTLEMHNDVMKWEKVDPPLFWKEKGLHIVADRHLPDGTRQHMVMERVPPGLIVSNAEIIYQGDATDAQYSSRLSHLSDAGPDCHN